MQRLLQLIPNPNTVEHLVVRHHVHKVHIAMNIMYNNSMFLNTVWIICHRNHALGTLEYLICLLDQPASSNIKTKAWERVTQSRVNCVGRVGTCSCYGTAPIFLIDIVNRAQKSDHT